MNLRTSFVTDPSGGALLFLQAAVPERAGNRDTHAVPPPLPGAATGLPGATGG